jgi:dihydrofolate synthase/folylpolyglutamate synthase
MIASVLMEAGYKTGLYTSPHLTDFRERIRVNGKMIPKTMVTEFIKIHSTFIRRLKPSFFEMTVAMAFDYFKKAEVDIAVIEVGLGGRLDSTNIIKPILSVITNIGYDHTDLLGDTLQKIAWEKAGIIKPGVPVVISETQDETRELFLEKARESGSELFFADKNYKCILDEIDYNSGKRRYSVNELSSGSLIRGEISLGGDYQARNIQAVFQSVAQLKNIIPCKDKSLIDGIKNVTGNTGLMGRWQIIGRSPLIICDTGHNREGLAYVVNQIGRIRKGILHMVIGFVSDKDRGSILSLLPASARYYFTKASVPRALDERILMAEAAQFNLKGSSHADVGSALQAARAEASGDDVIFIGGSTFVVADALNIV